MSDIKIKQVKDILSKTQDECVEKINNNDYPNSSALELVYDSICTTYLKEQYGMILKGLINPPPISNVVELSLSSKPPIDII